MIKYSFLWAIVISLASAAPPTAPNLLEQAGQRVKLFAEQFADVTCIEELTQEKLNEKGKTALRNESRYEYLIVLARDRGELLVDESRTELDPPRKARPTGSLLATRGFATLEFILHPDFQESYKFEAPVEEKGFMRIDFVPRAGSRSPGVLELKGREYPILWEGSAWIDPATATVARIQARWKQPPEELGLKSLESDVSYGPTTLRGKTYWLPQSASVALQSAHQTWRNVHKFSQYRLFFVDTKEASEAIK